MNWEKRRGYAHSGGILRKGGALLLSIVLALTVALPNTPVAEAASGAGDEGFVGTDDYNLFFKRIDGNGKDVFKVIDNKTFRVATTNEEDTCALRSEAASGRKMWESGAGIVSEKPISFAQDWVISVSATCPKPVLTDTMVAASSQLNIAFGDKQDLGTSFRIAGVYGWSWASDKGYSCRAMSGTISNGTWATTTAQQGLPETTPDDTTMVMRYDSAQDIATFETAGVTLTFPGIGASMGGRAYLSIVGAVNWTNEAGTVGKNRPAGMEQDITFESMILPHLTPSISDVTIANLDGTPIQKEDAVESGTVVKVRCLVQNTHKQAGSEQFPMHLSLATADTAYKTHGIEPIFGDDHPLKMREVGAAEWTDLTATAAAEFNAGEGIPLTLRGNTPVEVTYYARVNQSDNEAVVLGQALEEDFFGGIHREKAELLSRRTLTPGDGDVTGLTPGKDYHYTRLPAANANGWNGIATSPVDVTFYGGAGCDFDRFSVTDGNGTVLGALTDTDNVWSQTEDVDALAVEYQAANAGAGTISSKGADTIRIDTQAPTLSWNADAGTLVASDAAPAGSGKATSGVWKVRRVLQGRAAPLANAQTEWSFSLADGKGKVSETVSGAAPGFYVAEDAAGNVSEPVEAKEQSAPGPKPDDPVNPSGPSDPTDPDKPSQPEGSGGPDKPLYPTVTPRPDPASPSAPAPKPLPPAAVGTDPTTGTAHARVEDTLRQPLSETPVTPAMMAGLIDERYIVGSSLADSAVIAGTVRLFDADGTRCEAIDRSRPGTWYAEQTFTDSAGNSTTIRLTVVVNDGTTAGSLVTDGGGADKGRGDGTADDGGDHRTDLANRLGKLPQTGGILGPCPLHGLFALMMVMASAYSLARLRQRRRDRGAARAGRDVRYTAFDGFVHATVALSAIALGALSFCPWDLLWAAAVLATVAAWATLLNRPGRRPGRLAAR